MSGRKVSEDAKALRLNVICIDEFSEIPGLLSETVHFRSVASANCEDVQCGLPIFVNFH